MNEIMRAEIIVVCLQYVEKPSEYPIVNQFDVFYDTADIHLNKDT